MKLQNFDFRLHQKESKYIGCGISLIIFDILSYGTTLPQKLNDTIYERLITFGYNDVKIENPQLWVYISNENTLAFISLITSTNANPIFIKNRFNYNAVTLESDVINIFKQWINIYNLIDDVKEQLENSFMQYKDLSIIEETDKFIITIAKEKD